MHLLLGLALAIGMGVDTPKSAPIQVPIITPPTFRETFFAEVDRANTLYMKYYKTECTAPNYKEVDEAMHKEYDFLKSMAVAVRTQETDPLAQAHEMETFLGFTTILSDTVKSHRECEKDYSN